MGTVCAPPATGSLVPAPSRSIHRHVRFGGIGSLRFHGSAGAFKRTVPWFGPGWTRRGRPQAGAGTWLLTLRAMNQGSGRDFLGEGRVHDPGRIAGDVGDRARVKEPATRCPLAERQAIAVEEPERARVPDHGDGNDEKPPGNRERPTRETPASDHKNLCREGAVKEAAGQRVHG